MARPDYTQKVGGAGVDRQGQTKGNYGADPDVKASPVRTTPSPLKP